MSWEQLLDPSKKFLVSPAPPSTGLGGKPHVGQHFPVLWRCLAWGGVGECPKILVGLSVGLGS